ncbi:MAG: PAS domain-containing sensor histidine kinase [Candidatus Lokiarchaeota archaeon]|nr:PAS domain-containing sensor histidine kinase [Candidatus Lokiarchaeota archaeon]
MEATNTELAENPELFTLVFNSIQDGISILDKDLNIVRVNPVMEKWYKHAMPFAGKKCHEVYHGTRQPCNPCPSVRALETKAPAVDIVPYHGPGGRLDGWLELSSLPLKDGAGHIIGILEFVRDVTDKRKYEEILKNENERLKEIDEIRQAFIVKATHELKTPVTNITGAIQLFETMLDPRIVQGNMKTIMDILDRGSKRLQRLVMKLLDFSRIELQKLELDKQSFDLVPIVKGIIEELDYKIKESNHQVTMDLPTVCVVQGDQLRIEEVVMNIMTNAVKYTPRNGKITISVATTPTHVKFAVTDNGVGLSSDEKNILFTKFGSIYRKQLEGKIETYGTGVGLFISKEIIDAHGGKIWAESDGRDKGSTFSFIIPKNG